MGRRFIRLLDGQLQHLRDHCQHGNRSFFYDQLVVAHLLAFFNPILAGWRKIEDVFDVPAVRKRLKMPRGTVKKPTQESPYARLTLDELEALITEREQKLAHVQERFGDPDVYKAPDAINELRAEFDTLKEEPAAAEVAWLAKVDKA